MQAALRSVRLDVPSMPGNGIGKDHGKSFEEKHWTEQERTGYQAYVDTLKIENNDEE